MQALNTYTNDPQFALTQPTPTTIVLAAVTTSCGGTRRHFSGHTISIPAPTEPTWFYVTIDDSNLPTCQTENTLCGELGHTYLGAILATPSGGETTVLPGGWPAPQAVLVVA